MSSPGRRPARRRAGSHSPPSTHWERRFVLAPLADLAPDLVDGDSSELLVERSGVS